MAGVILSASICNELRSHTISPRGPALPGQHMCQPARPRAQAEEFKKVALKFATWNFQWWKLQKSSIRSRKAENVDRLSKIFSKQITSSSLKISLSHVRATWSSNSTEVLWEHDSVAIKVSTGSICVRFSPLTLDSFRLKLVLVLCQVNPSKSDMFDFGTKNSRSCLRMMTLTLCCQMQKHRILGGLLRHFGVILTQWGDY